MKILIRATNWVGDAIMALPAIRAIRNRPDASVSILARSYVVDVYRDQNVADELIIYDYRGKHAGIYGRERLASELRSRGFDVAILFQNAFDAAWLAWRAAIPERIGYARDARSILLTKAVPVPKPGEIPTHEKFYYLELLRRCGWIDAIPDEPFIKLQVTQGDRTRLHAGRRQFFVTPSFNLKTIEMVKRYSKVIMPGALTPTEVLTAWEAGGDAIKIFPCSAVGGAKYIKALRAPFPHIEMIPTGGVNLETAADFSKPGLRRRSGWRVNRQRHHQRGPFRNFRRPGSPLHGYCR